MRVSPVRYSDVGCETGLLASNVFLDVFCLLEVHISQWSLTDLQGRRVCEWRRACVCVCAGRKAWVTQIVQKQRLRRFSSSERLWRLRWQTKEKRRGQTFHFRTKQAAWSLIWRSCWLHPAGWLHAEIHKPGTSASPWSLDHLRTITVRGIDKVADQPQSLSW